MRASEEQIAFRDDAGRTRLKGTTLQGLRLHGANPPPGHVHIPSPMLHQVPWQSNDPLYERLREHRVRRGDELDRIAALEGLATFDQEQ